jgi:hypothetical protein
MDVELTPGSEPLAVHEGDGVLGLNLLGEGDEPVAFALQGLRVADHPTVAEIEKQHMEKNVCR